MTPEQALQMLDNLGAQVNLTREQHAQVSQAVAVLAALIKEAEDNGG